MRATVAGLRGISLAGFFEALSMARINSRSALGQNARYTRPCAVVSMGNRRLISDGSLFSGLRSRVGQLDLGSDPWGGYQFAHTISTAQLGRVVS